MVRLLLQKNMNTFHVKILILKIYLEEDDDKIELIEYEFGKDGKPLLIGRLNDLLRFIRLSDL